MSKLSAFLRPVTETVEKEVVISDRFVGEDGKPVPFRIKALTQEENDAIVRAATRVEFKNGQRIESLVSVEYARRAVVAATVEPDFSSKELCDHYGVVSPQLVPGRMLLAGEYNRLLQEITALGAPQAAALEQEVKN